MHSYKRSGHTIRNRGLFHFLHAPAGFLVKQVCVASGIAVLDSLTFLLYYLVFTKTTTLIEQVDVLSRVSHYAGEHGHQFMQEKGAENERDRKVSDADCFRAVFAVVCFAILHSYCFGFAEISRTHGFANRNAAGGRINSVRAKNLEDHTAGQVVFLGRVWSVNMLCVNRQLTTIQIAATESAQSGPLSQFVTLSVTACFQDVWLSIKLRCA